MPPPPPRPHQLEELQRTADLPNWALWWDQGTGKTKVVIDTACYLYEVGKINAMLVIAPGGVEANWIYDELPKWMTVAHEAFLWSSGKRHTKKYKAAWDNFLTFPALKVLAISYDAIMTDDGAKAVRKFMDKHEVLYVADETTAIKTPDAKVTKRVVASSKHARYRRLLNGTPVEDSPFHAYTQVKWVDPSTWTRIGIKNYSEFKTFFGIWEKRRRRDGREFPSLVEHRNLDILQRTIYEVGSRVLKEDVLDLPEKIFTKVYFDISPKQRKHYDDLRDDYCTRLASGEMMDAEMAIVRLLRFQQITSGYLPAGEDEPIKAIEDKNPRIQVLGNVLDSVPRKAIIWGKYDVDIDAIAELLRKRRHSFVTYDGRTSPEAREKAKQEFQNGDVRFFVAKASAAGRGLTLTAADTVIYYNNDFSCDRRKQSEDRAHRIGQTRHVTYIDIVAKGTVDEHILAVLRRKRSTSAIVTGDDLASWI